MNVKWKRDGSWLVTEVNGRKLEISACRSGERYTGAWTVLVDGVYNTQTRGAQAAKRAALRAIGVELPPLSVTSSSTEDQRHVLLDMAKSEKDPEVRAKLEALAAKLAREVKKSEV